MGGIDGVSPADPNSLVWWFNTVGRVARTGSQMSIKDAVSRLFGGSGEPSETSEEGPETATPSHVCVSCGEEYYTDPGLEIDTCRNCGGVKVETA